MTNTPRQLKVFLCHSSHDKAIVRELYQRLNAESWIDPWLDEENLYPGQDWDLEIEKAVESADAVVICLSNNSVNKEGYLQRELRFVLRIADYKPEGTVFVIPVRLDGCHIPRRLEMWQFVDYFPEDRKDWAYQRLLGSLKVRAQKLGIPTVDPLAEAKARQEKQEREASEKAAREKSEREAAQKTAREKAEREAAQKAAREKAEREIADKAAREKAAQAAAGNNAPFDDVLGKPVKPFPVEQKALEKPPRKLKTEYIIAIIGAAATILAALIGVLPKIIKPSSTPTDSFYYMVRITTVNSVPITNAKITLEINSNREILSAMSDSDGLAVILIDTLHMHKPARIRIEAAGYRTFIQYVDLTEDGLPLAIQLETESSPTVTFIDSLPSVTPEPSLPSTEVYTPTISPTPLLTVYDPHPAMDDYHDAFGVPMRLVSAQPFAMGSYNGYSNEKPVYLVELDTFYTDKYEVTNMLYQTCVVANVCKPPTDPRSHNIKDYYGNEKYSNYPVVHLLWEYAKTYCEWRGARLPTEAEWELAARGIEGFTFPWGNTYNRNEANLGNDAVEIGSYPNDQSPFGIYDMGGNASEMVSSLYKPYPYDAKDGREDLNAIGIRVIRGGYFSPSPITPRAAYRSYGENRFNVGFRCVRDIQP